MDSDGLVDERLGHGCRKTNLIGAYSDEISELPTILLATKPRNILERQSSAVYDCLNSSTKVSLFVSKVIKASRYL